MIPKNSPWTAVRVERLKSLWAADAKLKTIAEVLNAMVGLPVTRLAVRRKAAALGLKGRSAKFTTKFTDEMFERLKVLAAQNWSGQDIADELGVGRSVVCGHAQRLGISLGGGRGGPRDKAEGESAPKKKSIGRLLVGTVPKAGNMALVEASMQAEIGLPPTDDPTSPKGCRWPVGDPANIAVGGFRYCQRERRRRADGTRSSYCEDHFARASGGIPGRKVTDYEPRNSRRGFKKSVHSDTWT